MTWSAMKRLAHLHSSVPLKGLCRMQQKRLVEAIEKATDHGAVLTEKRNTS